MNTLVTGGTGFIGSVLVGRLLKDGNKVIILTRNKKKVNNSFKNNIEVLEVDICNSVSLKNLELNSKDTDIIFHLAASLDYFGDKRKLFQVNVEGTINLLNLAERNRIKKFVFISSIEAMGMIRRNEIPVDETLPCKPVSTYGESKLEAEERVTKFAKEKNLNTVTLRLGNVYGPGSPAFIIPIANAILTKGKLFSFLPVYKDRYLHPVYIEDVVEGIIKAAQRSDACGTYVIAGEEYVTIGVLFELIAKALNVDTDLQVKNRNIRDELCLNLRKKIHRFRKKADMLTYFVTGGGEKIHRAYSIGKAKRELDYSPKVNLKEGIAKTLQWAKKEGLLVK